jgi:general secretion pathway protein D
MNHKLRTFTALFLASCQLGLVSAQAQTPTALPTTTPGAQVGTITLSFQNADVGPVAAAVAKAVGQSIIVDPRVKGKITLNTPQPVTPQTALDMFSSALRSASFALVQVNGMYRVVPDADARVQGNTVLTQNNPEGDQVVTRVFKIKQDSASNLVNVLRPLLTQNSSITANPGNNTLIVTDYASNVKRVAKLLESMDDPSIGDVQAVHLKYAVALDVASILSKVVDNNAGGTQTPGVDSKVIVLAEPRSNSVLIKASNPEKIQQLRSLIARLDTPSASNGNMWVVPLRNAEAAKLAVTLRAIVAADSTLSQQAGATNLGAAAGGGMPQAPQMPQGMAQGSGLVGGAAGGAAAGGAAGGASAAATGALSSTSQPNVGGMIQADTATNSLIITASESFYRNLREVIDKLDRRRTQVYVEALIVEVESSNSAQLGIQWQGLINSGGQNVPFGGTNYGAPPAGVNIVDLSRNAAAILNPALGGVDTLAKSNGLNIGMLSKFGGNYTVSALISALDKEGGSRILSTPNLVTLDNEEARIMVGQNVPILAGSYTTNATSQTTPFQTFNRLDVGILLRVRPQISNNGTIRLTVYQEVSTVAPSAPTTVQSQGYTINKRTIESNVIVDDGQMFVIGGLIGDDYYDTSDGVPFLKDIPLIGALFRYDSKTRKKSNLMVFLRPYVIKDAQAAEEITTSRQEYMQGKQESFKQLPMLLPKENLPTIDDVKAPLVKPGPLPAPAPTLRP